MGVNNSFNITLTGDNGVSAYLTGSGTGVWSGGPAPVPVAAALPLFAGGLTVLGLLGWCVKRRAQAT
jgi:hypothetical protein